MMLAIASAHNTNKGTFMEGAFDWLSNQHSTEPVSQRWSTSGMDSIPSNSRQVRKETRGTSS